MEISCVRELNYSLSSYRKNYDLIEASYKEMGRKKLIRYLQWVSIGLFVGVWMWTILPNGQVTHEFQYNDDFGLFQDEVNCSGESQLVNSQYTLVYPRTLRLRETSEIYLNLNPSENVINEKDDDCVVALEVNLILSEVMIEPGMRLVIPININRPQTLRFRITADKKIDRGRIKGDLLIYAMKTFTLKDKESVERIPLFAIPVHIQMIDLMGIPIQFLRLGSLLATLFLIIASGLFRWCK